MEGPSKNILISLPYDVVVAIDEIVPRRGRGAYIRSAVALRLAMDLKAAQDGTVKLDADVRKFIAHVLRAEYGRT